MTATYCTVHAEFAIRYYQGANTTWIAADNVGGTRYSQLMDLMNVATEMRHADAAR